MSDARKKLIILGAFCYLYMAPTLAEDPLTLDKMIEMAVTTHPAILARKSDVGSAKAAVDAAEWEYYPTPSLQTEQFKGQRSLTIRLQQPLWTGGRITAAVEAARQREMVARWSVPEIRQNVALQVVNQYGNLMAASGTRRANENGIRRMDDLSKTVERRFLAGISARADVELLSARIAQMRSDLAQSQQNERAAAQLLSQYINNTVDPDNVEGQANIPEKPISENDLVTTAMANNPTLQRLNREHEAARADIDIAKAALWPTLSARAERQYGQIQGSLPADARIYLSMQMNPGAGLSLGSQIKAREAKLESIQQNIEASRRDILAQISNDLDAYLTTKSRAQEAKNNMQAAEKVLISYKRMFLAGKRGWLDLVNALRELVQAEQIYGQIKAQQISTYYRLKIYRGEMPWMAAYTQEG